MKNSQKGSAKVWLIVLVVIIVVLVGAFFILKNVLPETCTINGVVTSSANCNLPPGTPVTLNDYTQVVQTMNQVQSELSKSAPSGSLVPTTVPSGYKAESGSPMFGLYGASSAEWFFSTGSGLQGQPSLEFQEDSNSPSVNAFVAAQLGHPTIAQTFTYNGQEGDILTFQDNIPPYELVYDYNSMIVRITTLNDPTITPAILISLLEAMTVAK